MEYIKEWLNNVTMYLIFTIVINVIIANKSYKKYVDLIVGFVFILILLNPINKIFKTNFNDLSKEIEKYEQKIEERKESINYEHIKADNQKIIAEIYRNNLKEQLIDLIKSNYKDINIIYAKIIIEEGADNVGDIRSIDVTARVKSEINDKTQDGKNIEEKLKKLIKNFYNIVDENIHVNVQV